MARTGNEAAPRRNARRNLNRRCPPNAVKISGAFKTDWLRVNKLDDLTADFSCSTSKICGTGNFPTPWGDPRHQGHRPGGHRLPSRGSITTPSSRRRSVRSGCRSRVSRGSFWSCPPPEPAPRVDGAVIVGIFGDRIYRRRRLRLPARRSVHGQRRRRSGAALRRDVL